MTPRQEGARVIPIREPGWEPGQEDEPAPRPKIAKVPASQLRNYVGPGLLRKFDSPDPEVRQFTVDHDLEASDQIIGAKDALYRPDDDWVDVPWHDLAMLLGAGGLPGAFKPGDIVFICAFSGNGKTLVVTSLIDHWSSTGVKTYVLPLENRPDDFRLYMACQSIGLNPGIVNSGGLRHMAPDVRASWEKKIDEALDVQLLDRSRRETLKVKGVKAITLKRLTLAAEEAADWGAKIMVVDHIDQIDVANGATDVAESKAIHQGAKILAERFNMVFLFTSQMNNEALRGNGRDYLAQYGPAQPNHVYLGGHKRMIATVMLNLHRRLRAPKPLENPKEYAAALTRSRKGEAPVMDALEPNVMAVSLMKGRNNGGEKEMARTFLGVERGKIIPVPERDRYSTYTIGRS